ncbi:hypothetical protein SAMN05518848_103448 [Paenibacillus sp. PDC88]|nr:hypothetical protein SAMN05518848_103448 [Paenibacillus sp. PDC88]
MGRLFLRIEIERIHIADALIPTAILASHLSKRTGPRSLILLNANHIPKVVHMKMMLIDEAIDIQNDIQV